MCARRTRWGPHFAAVSSVLLCGCFQVSGPIDPQAVAIDLTADGGAFPAQVGASAPVQTAVAFAVAAAKADLADAGLAPVNARITADEVDAGAQFAAVAVRFMGDEAAAAASFSSIAAGLADAGEQLSTKLGTAGGSIRGDLAITGTLTVSGTSRSTSFALTSPSLDGGTTSYGLLCGSTSRPSGDGNPFASIKQACVTVCGAPEGHFCTEDEVAHVFTAGSAPRGNLIPDGGAFERLGEDCVAWTDTASTSSTFPVLDSAGRITDLGCNLGSQSSFLCCR